MKKITFKRSPSLTTIVLVLLIIFLIQASISYTLTYGVLSSSFPHTFPHSLQDLIATGWLVFRALMIVVLLGFWFLYRMRPLFITIIIVNSVYTFALFVNTVSLVIVLFGISSMDIKTLLGDVVLLAVSNILIFSIWYWVIDPPGVEDSRARTNPGISSFHNGTETCRFTNHGCPVTQTTCTLLSQTASHSVQPIPYRSPGGQSC